MPMRNELGARYTLRLVDGLGRELDVQTGRFTSDGISYRISGEGRAAGVYHLSVTTEHGTRSATVTLVR